jgi:hypothetical protein
MSKSSFINDKISSIKLKMVNKNHRSASAKLLIKWKISINENFKFATRERGGNPGYLTFIHEIHNFITRTVCEKSSSGNTKMTIKCLILHASVMYNYKNKTFVRRVPNVQ